MSVRDEIREALATVPQFVERDHEKLPTVRESSYEVLYGGGDRTGTGFRHRWHVIILGSLTTYPTAEVILSEAMRKAGAVLLALDCVFVDSIEVSIESPANSDHTFTRGVVILTETVISDAG